MVERVVVGPWKTNCYIYSSAKKECIIIDPGGSDAEIMARVDVLNMVPTGIALTHGHVDHVAALGKLVESYGARGYRLPVAISPADRQFLGMGGRETHRESLEFLGLDEMSFFGIDPAELPKADVRLKDGDRVFDMDLIVLETPGHTPGSVCFYSEKEGILLSGDTLFFDGVGRTDLPGGNERKLRESIQKKIAVLPPETRIFPGHGPFTSVEREKRGNAYMKSVPERPGLPAPSKASTPVVKTPVAVMKTPVAVVKATPLPVVRPTAPVQSQAKPKAPVKPRTQPKRAEPSRRASNAPHKVVKPVAKAASARKSSSVAKTGVKRPSPKGKVQATRSTKAPGSKKKPAR
jgi:glyoxylase-like metal-dependent hydrolase (beta-lactamase superfamily II)